MAVHYKLKEATKKNDVKKAGKKEAGLGKVAWRKTSKESFCSAKVEQEQASNQGWHFGNHC